MCIAFVFTSCGPFGVETAVAAGGPLYTAIGVLLTPLLYVIPQVLMVSELSMMMPSNHGYILWVARGWGPLVGFFNAYNALAVNTIDLALYPVLASSYVVTYLLPGSGLWTVVAVRCALIGVGVGVSLLSARVVSDGALGMCALIVVPFVVLFVVAAPAVSPAEQWLDVPASVPWGSFTASLLWLYTGWNALGALAGEVQGSGVYIRGLGGALVLDVLLYVLPLMAALTVREGTWGDGFLSFACEKIVPGSGKFVVALATVSQLGLFVSGLLCYSRVVWGMAELGWLPRSLRSLSPRTGAPQTAVLAQAAAIIPLMFLDFSYLQRMEFILAAVAYIATFTAFLRLRYTEPATPRPYLVGGGLPVAWLITATKVFVMLSVAISNARDPALVALALVVNGGIGAAYVVFGRKMELPPGAEPPAVEAVETELASPGAGVGSGLDREDTRRYDEREMLMDHWRGC